MIAFDYLYCVLYRHFIKVDKYESTAAFSTAIVLSFFAFGNLLIVSGFFMAMWISPDRLHSFLEEDKMTPFIILITIFIPLLIFINTLSNKRTNITKCKSKPGNSNGIFAGILVLGSLFYSIASLVVFNFIHEHVYEWIW